MNKKIIIARESFDQFIRDALSLLEEHNDEVSRFDDIPVSLNVAAYAAIDAMGNLRVWTARNAAGELVGYFVFLIGYHPHFSQSLQASQDAVYLARDYRVGRNGLRLVKECENALRKEGVEMVYCHARAKYPRFGDLLSKIGYSAVEVVYGKRLN